MSLRSRFLLLALVGAASPLVAHAQEPQPWTNTSSFGDRVVPAFPVRTNEQVVVRADGGTGSTAAFDLTVARAQKGQGESSKATFLAGRTGMSFGWESFDVFLTSYAYRVSIPKLTRDANAGPLAVDPYTQTGDAAVGARWTTPIGRSLHAGVEGGAVFLGGTGDPGNTGVVFAGPNLAATSPFARGLFTWQGLGRSNGEPKLTASLNLGVFIDQSWNVWEKAVEDAGKDDETLDEPLEEERIAMSFYGEDGPATRLVFGTSVAYQAARVVRPFLELTGERTGPDTTMRVTPGFAIRPLGERPLELFLSADVALSDDHEASPRAPALRANAGLQFAFGERALSRPVRTPNPFPTPAPSRRGFLISVKVVDERGLPVSNAKVRVNSTAEGSPLLGEGTTEGNGTVNISTPPATLNGPNVSISARHADCVEWVPVTQPPKSSSAPVVVCYRQKTRVSIQFVERGNPWTPPPGVDVQFTPTAPIKTGRIFPLDKIDLPANDSFRKWQIAISIPDFPKVTGTVEDLAPPAQVLKVYVDSEKKCAEFKEEKCAGPAATPTPTPAAAMERFQFSVFEGDSVDVKGDEAQKLLVKLLPLTRPGHDHRVTVQAKKGDVLFQQALVAARRDALLAWLNGKGVEAGTVRIVTNHEAASDGVLLEVPK